MAQVSLTVRDLDRAVRFYTHILGLDEVDAGPSSLWLGAGDAAFLELTEDREAPRLQMAPGLFHLAILYPSRTDLAAVTARLIGLQAPLQGASDHGVSEAVYLADPEGNGIEVYRDRAEEDWPLEAGRLAMQTLPLDLAGLLTEAPEPEKWRVPAETRIGHIHLRVSNIRESEAFYRDVIGLDLMQRYGDSASFLAAGGYHHHVGVNTWGSLRADPRPVGCLGLNWFRLGIPDDGARTRLLERIRARQVPHTAQGGTIYVRDPSGNDLVV